MATFRMNAESMIRRRCVALAPRLRSRRALPGAAMICFSLLLVLVAARAATEEGEEKYSNVLGKASLSTRPAGESTALEIPCPHLVHLAENCSCPAEFLAELPRRDVEPLVTISLSAAPPARGGEFGGASCHASGRSLPLRA